MQEIVVSPIHFNLEKAKGLVFPKLSTDKINLLSIERFSCGVPGTCAEGLSRRVYVLYNLKRCFPDAKVIFVIRKQNELACAYYTEYVKSGGIKRLEEVCGFLKNNRLSLPALHFFQFSDYVNALKTFFLSGVLVLPFEELALNSELFLKKLNNFIGIEYVPIELKKLNKSKYSWLQLEILRFTNRFFKGRLNPNALFPGVSIKEVNRRHNPYRLLLAKQKTVGKQETLRQKTNFILDLMKTDNEKLDREHNLNLKRYGYY